jgi:cytosine/adenosine deaminase-related metal-dependent hydrolase
MGAPSSAATIFRARFVAPMSRPIIADGAVAVRGGRIMAAGSWAQVREAAGSGDVRDLGDAVLMPGLINAHTHLDLTEVPRPAEMPGFVPWLLTVISRRTEPASAVSAGIEQCRRFGVTCVGDITRQPMLIRPLLAGGGVRAVSFGEVTAMAGRRGLLEERIAAALSGRAGDFLHLGISPHAPYSIEPTGYARCLAEAKSRGLAMTTHLAESPGEAQFLEHHTGPFRELWEKIGGWDDSAPRIAGGPIRYAKQLGLIDYPTLLAHVNYCDDAELAILADGKASVAYCPRTHAYFQHPPHRWRDMLGAGINVAVGTDSAASSGDLNLLDDLRLLHHIAPDTSAEQLWQMATIRAAKALMLENQLGTLEEGKWADMVAFDATGSDSLREILETDALPREIWIAGK